MLAVAANRHSSFGSLNIFSRDQDLQGGYLVQIPTAMDRYQLSSVSPVQPTLVTPVEEGDPLSVPNTPLSPTFTHANLFGTSRLDGTSQSISQNSPPSPTLPKSVKRKRLAKACDACHRSKRRCEGTQPCSNCDFAGKVCTYTDASGRAVAPPRVRGVDGRSLSHHDAWPYPMRTSISGESELATFRPQTPVPTLSDHYPSALDPSLTKELVNLFFAHCHPVSFIFHRSTFLHDLARAQVPECLLWSILAVAAPHSLRVSSRSSPQWQAGEPFATKAANSLFLENQDMLDLPDSLDSLRIKPCLEVAQTLCLLQVHATVMRRSNKAASYLVLASSILDAAGVLSMTQSAFGQTFPSFVRNEATRRTFWYIHLQTFLSSAFTYQPLPNNSENLNNVPLPIEENSFDFPRVETLGDSGSIYQYLPLPVEHRPCASEFANLLRVSVIFACVVNAVAEKTHLLRTWDQVQSQHPKAPSISRFEADLRKWLELLPEHLRLTEDNLQSCISQLDGGGGSAAWAFIYMHALAESTVLALHEFADLGSEMPVKAAMSPREQKALGNLTMILGALGQRGRANLTMAFLLVAVAKYCSPQHPQIANWFEEYYRMWDISFEDLTNVAFRVSWFPVASQLSFGALQLRPVDHTFADSPVELGNPKRRMSSSDTSSTGITMTSRPRKVLGSPVGVGDPPSALLSTGQVFGPEERDMPRSLTGMLGHLNVRSAETNLPFISDKKWVTDGAGSRERLGSLTALVTTGGIAKAVSSSSLHPRRGFIGESLSEVELSALPTGGYTGRPIVDFGGDGQSIGGSPHASSSRSGSGVGPFLQNFEGDSHNRNMVLAPSMGQEFPFSIGPQPQYRSTPPSTSPYHDNVSDDADMTINADIAWLSGNEDIMQ